MYACLCGCAAAWTVYGWEEYEGYGLVRVRDPRPAARHDNNSAAAAAAGLGDLLRYTGRVCCTLAVCRYADGKYAFAGSYLRKKTARQFVGRRPVARFQTFSRWRLSKTF